MSALQPIKSGEDAFDAMRSALAAAGLPVDDLHEGDARYFALCGGEAFGGLVVSGDIALLRSMVVPDGARRRGVGGVLLAKLDAEAKARGVRALWLLTDSAEAFFAKHGFARAARADAPRAIQETRQFRELCPDSAALMWRAVA